MSGQHTKEPWKVSDECELVVDHDRYSSYSWAEIEGCGETVALSVSHRSDDLMEANARRIVACVNACAGISTETLERRGMIPVSALEQQRDELLDAARAAEAILARQKWRDDSTDPEAVALRMLRAAIASAEGTK